MKTWLSSLLAAAALGSTAAPAPLQAQQGTTVVVGQFVDAQTSAPLAGVNIKVPSAKVHVVTSPDGQFLLRLPPGTHAVALARLGYETVIEQWEVGTESLDMGIMKLQPDPVLLEGITATADRLERVRRSVPFQSRAFTTEELVNNASFDAADFVTSRSGSTTATCGTMRQRNCVRYRGRLTYSCIMVDDVQLVGGLSELELYHPSQFARMHVYRGGTFVQAYTSAYLKRLAREDRAPRDAQVQIRNCRVTI